MVLKTMRQKKSIKELKKEIRILKDIISFAINDWELKIDENEGDAGTITQMMVDVDCMKQSIEYFKKNYMYRDNK